MINIFCDGASRKNPGDSGIGVAIYDNSNLKFEICEYIGKFTNNEAEYYALIAGLNYLIKNKISEANFFCDSELLVKQLNKDYGVKKENLKILYEKINKKIMENNLKLKFIWIPRDNNKKADELSNKAIDEKCELEFLKNELVKTENKQSSQLENFILNKCFFGKITCLRVQINQKKEFYIHMGILKNQNWLWDKIKLNEMEIGEIIYSLNQIEHKTSFFHKFNKSSSQVWINKSKEKLTIKVNDVSKSFSVGEIEILKIILKKSLEIICFN